MTAGLHIGWRLPTTVLVIGASHQGEVVVELLGRQARGPRIVAVLDSSIEGRFVGRQVCQIPVTDHLGALPSYRGVAEGAIPAVGDGRERQRIVTAIAAAGLDLVGAVHPSAIVAHGVHIGPGTVVGAGAIVGVGATLGTGVIVNSGAIVEHHCRVGDFAHIAPGANLAGGVTVGGFAWIGLGATVLEDLAVGGHATVGAGALVTRDVGSGVTVVGVPARPREAQSHIKMPGET